MITPDKRAKLEHWISEIQHHGRDLSEWEDHFVESVEIQLAQKGSLSPKQEEILERIYAEKTP